MRKRIWTNERIFQMRLDRVYPLLENKAIKKNRTREEVRTVTCRLTGYTVQELEQA